MLELPVLSRTMCRWHTLIALDGTLNPMEEGHFNCVPLNKLLSFCEDYITHGRQHSPRIDFDMSAQWLQLLDEKSCDGDWGWIIQSAVTDALCYFKRNKLSMLRALESIVIWAWVFVCEICTSILCYRIRPSRQKKRRFNLKNRDTLFLLCKSVERMSRD